MIITNSNIVSLNNLKLLLNNTVNFLNNDAIYREEFYKNNSGIKLEKIIYDTLKHQAIKTQFNNKIKLISGLKFPDIVIDTIYGLEVKSSQSERLETTGNSIVETNRDQKVEHIFLLFCKLVSPITFICKPYQDCLTDIRVTHSPRYIINMNSNINDTIFTKINISYDEFRNLKYPVEKIKEYYKKQLGNNEYLWWLDKNKTAPIKLIDLTKSTIHKYTEYILTCIVLFPEILGKSAKNKYKRVINYLLSEFGIISSNIRDIFSAGGKFNYTINGYNFINIPRVYRLIISNIEIFKNILLQNKSHVYNMQDISNNEVMLKWIDKVCVDQSNIYKEAQKLLNYLLLL
jgi:hypothetical protein